MKRRNFINNSTHPYIGVSLLGLYDCKKKVSNSKSPTEKKLISAELMRSVKLLPAQCSFHKIILDKTLNSMDFGDFWNRSSVEKHDKYMGVRELTPYAKGVSTKSFNFDNNEQQMNMDFLKRVVTK